MISTNMKEYNYYLYGENNSYGQPQLSKEPQGKIKMSINVTSQRIQDNPLYQGAEFVGLTHVEVDDKYVIQFEDLKLKVLYINPFGRYKQVFMARV